LQGGAAAAPLWMLTVDRLSVRLPFWSTTVNR
jgi:hypothetical protein